MASAIACASAGSSARSFGPTSSTWPAARRRAYGSGSARRADSASRRFDGRRRRTNATTSSAGGSLRWCTSSSIRTVGFRRAQIASTRPGRSADSIDRPGDAKSEHGRIERFDAVEGRRDGRDQHDGVIVAIVDGHVRDARQPVGPLAEQGRLAVAGRRDDRYDGRAARRSMSRSMSLARGRRPAGAAGRASFELRSGASLTSPLVSGSSAPRVSAAIARSIRRPSRRRSASRLASRRALRDLRGRRRLRYHTDVRPRREFLDATHELVAGPLIEWPGLETPAEVDRLRAPSRRRLGLGRGEQPGPEPPTS